MCREINQLDAFPSGHTTVSLTFFPSLHYVVDLLAGALLAAVVPGAATVLERVVSGDVHVLRGASVVPKGGSHA